MDERFKAIPVKLWCDGVLAEFVVIEQYQALKAECERLTEERDFALRPTLYVELRDEIERLRAALSHYGDHTYACTATDNTPCTCGFTAALRGADSAGTDNG